MDTLRADLRFALRSFGRAPGITALSLVTLGLGIGANTAIFTFLNEVLLKPMPFRAPRELVVIGPNWDGVPGAVSPEQFVYLRQNARSFASMRTFFLYRGENVETAADARHVFAQQVSEGWFRVLDMPPRAAAECEARSRHASVHGRSVAGGGRRIWARAGAARGAHRCK